MKERRDARVRAKDGKILLYFYTDSILPEGVFFEKASFAEGSYIRKIGEILSPALLENYESSADPEKRRHYLPYEANLFTRLCTEEGKNVLLLSFSLRKGRNILFESEERLYFDDENRLFYKLT